MTPELTKLIINAITHACEISYNVYQDNCSGFLRTVAAAVSANTPLKIHLSGEQANDQVEYCSRFWARLRDGMEAQAQAQGGAFVVAGLKSSDSKKEPKPTHGHVAVVVPGPLYHGKYPKVWCGGSVEGRSRGTKSVGEVWAVVDRDQVGYYTPLMAAAA